MYLYYVHVIFRVILYFLLYVYQIIFISCNHIIFNIIKSSIILHLFFILIFRKKIEKRKVYEKLSMY